MGKSWDQYRIGEPYEAPRRKGLKTFAIVAALMAITILPAMAAKGGAGGGGGGKVHGGSGGSGGGTLVLRVLTGPDNVPNWGEQITFDVSTTATTQPYVRVDCYQNGEDVYWAATGYFASYPWPWTQTMTLSSQMWTGGDADCTAVLSSQDGGRTTTLSTLKFTALA